MSTRTPSIGAVKSGRKKELKQDVRASVYELGDVISDLQNRLMREKDADLKNAVRNLDAARTRLLVALNDYNWD